MTPQETDLTTILLDRLSKTEGQPKDAEAETMIRKTTAELPGETEWWLQNAAGGGPGQGSVQLQT
jgi:hypothetical protein